MRWWVLFEQNFYRPQTKWREGLQSSVESVSPSFYLFTGGPMWPMWQKLLTLVSHRSHGDTLPQNFFTWDPSPRPPLESGQMIFDLWLFLCTHDVFWSWGNDVCSLSLTRLGWPITTGILIIWLAAQRSKRPHLLRLMFQCNCFTCTIFHHPARPNVNMCPIPVCTWVTQDMGTQFCMPLMLTEKWGRIRTLHWKCKN